MTEAKPARVQKKSPQLIGWRELVALPDFGIERMKAKIDTGARTSALHARDVRVFEEQGEHWVEFTPVVAERHGADHRVRARLVEKRPIKNTSGIPDERHIVLTRLTLAGRTWPIEVSLADRERMEFDLILGRTAIRRRRLLIEPGKSFLAGAPSTDRNAEQLFLTSGGGHRLGARKISE